MKYKKVFRILAVTLTLALLVMAIPASLAMAIADIEIENIEGTEGTNPYYGEAKGEIGDEIRITGADFGAGVNLIFYFSSQEASVGQEIDEEVTVYEQVTTDGAPFGFFEAYFDVPEELNDGPDPDEDEDVHDGRYYIYITDDDTKHIIVLGEFTVVGVGGIIGFSPDEGTVGTEVEIAGAGFASEEVIIIEYDGDEIEIADGDTETRGDGSFELTVVIPESTYGEHTITIIGEDSLAELEEVFFVIPEIVIDPETGEASTTVIIVGTGFDRYGDVAVYFDGTKVKEKRAGSDGGFDTFFDVPAEATEAVYTVLAEDMDDDDIFAEADFTVTAPPLDAAIIVDPTTVNVDDEVEVSGTEFAPNDTVTIYFDNEIVDTATTLTDGSFTGFFDVPESVSGSHTIKAEDTDGGVATATITVEPKIALDIVEGPGGTKVTVTGAGFGYRSDIDIVEFDGTNVDIDSGDDRAGMDGSFEFSFVVPAVGAGSYDVTVGDEDGNSADAEFTVVAAAATITPASGVIETEVTVSGTDFIADSAITITYYLAASSTTGSTAQFTATAGSDGAFSAIFDIPASEGGNHNIVIRDSTNSVTINFVVLADATISATSGSVGDEVTISGTGFRANTTVTITYASTSVELATKVTNDKGSFSQASCTIPTSAGGDHTITVSDGVNTKQFIFTMETTKPPTPQQLPLGTDKPKQPITFDWSDVTDDSMPVTYSLQVATDANYGNVLVSKTGLADSEYTLTEEEELEPVSKDSPYYWRVSSTDDAGNMSDWGPSATFYVGSTWPGWLMWLWIGLGALVLGIFFFWLGRRIAFSSY